MMSRHMTMCATPVHALAAPTSAQTQVRPGEARAAHGRTTVEETHVATADVSVDDVTDASEFGACDVYTSRLELCHAGEPCRA
jgi:hypothetical protein